MFYVRQGGDGKGETMLDIYILSRGSSLGGVFTCYITFRTHTLSYWNYFPGVGGVLVLQFLEKTGRGGGGGKGAFCRTLVPG